MSGICQCGIPLGISRGNVWHADGTISAKHPPYIRGTFFDADELNYVFDSLSGRLGYDVHDLVAAGRYRDSNQYMVSFMERLKEASGGRLPDRESMYRTMVEAARLWGLADVEGFDLEKMKAAVRNPYSVPLFCGDLAAVVAAVEGWEVRAKWEGDEVQGMITLEPSAFYVNKLECVEQELPAFIEPAAEELSCERCDSCGAPKAVSEIFRWEIEKGKIVERSTGRCYCFNDTNGMVAVFRRVVCELGKEIDQLFIDIAREYSRELYSGLRGVFSSAEELESFPLRGWGILSESVAEGRHRTIMINDPYCENLLPGRVWGMIEAEAGFSLNMAKSIAPEGSMELVFIPA